MANKINKSEIINQKKQFVFEVEQTSDYVFPNEEFYYYIYVKNISGTDIENFTIQVENSLGIVFESDNLDHKPITLKENIVKLYDIKVHCSMIGEHIVHFIGFGEGTQILHKTLKINCTRTHNSDTLLHRIHIYNFTPYEENYSMEADNYNNQVTQIFKKQKLPMKAKEQPFMYESTSVPENIESISYEKQYDQLKNTKEHVYQYLGRENFTENSLELYTGENLSEIFKKINEESEYFRGRLYRSGTNHLLNDFNRFAPNGFIYRMGLLNSEIFHNLGVLPTYSYMSDKLFRWAPEGNQLLNLTPKKEAMHWDENIWAGRGWLVYQDITEEYTKTEEYSKEKENGTLIPRQIIGCFEEEKDAEEFVAKKEKWDAYDRNQKMSSLVKYKYEILESLYDRGVFFINIPLNKIPANFFLLNKKSMSAMIERAKPLGTKPIINYVIEKTFNHHMDQLLTLNYYKKAIFSLEADDMIDYHITENKCIPTEITCEDGNTINYMALKPTRLSFISYFPLKNDMELNVDYSNIRINDTIEMNMMELGDYSKYIYETKNDYRLNTLEDLLSLIIEENYNNISFRIPRKEFDATKNDFDSLKIKTSEKNKRIIQIEDVYNRKYKFSSKYDEDLKKDFITYTYTDTRNKNSIRKRGYQNIISLVSTIAEVENKKILLFFVESEDRYLHYFHHVLIQDILDIQGLEVKNDEIKEVTTIKYAKNLLKKSIIFETPFIIESLICEDNARKGSNWTNLYRLNEKTNSYSYIRNITNKYITPDDILFYYDDINIPETAIIKGIRVKLVGISEENQVHISRAFNSSYLLEEVNGNKIQISPEKIECYSHLRESPTYYQIKLDAAREKGLDTYIERFLKLLDEDYIYNEDIDIAIDDYLLNPNDYITINNKGWYEISKFSDLKYKLNDIESINLVIEGYNTERETKLFAQTLSETESSSPVTSKIPSGFFRKKIPLLYPNKFLLELLRVRFRFESLNYDIKIFDTKIELKFKKKQDKEVDYEIIDSINIDGTKYIDIAEKGEYIYPPDINNGLALKLSFDDLKPGAYYQLNSIEVEVIYQETDIDMMINKNKYSDIFYGINKSTISGISEGYLSGEFYNDVITVQQADDNVGIENKGIKLQNGLYQLFEAHDDNITSIELFPYGFKGNPDSILKIGLYTNSYNTPGKLIKEINVNGWLKNNEKLKGLDRIKYNFNVFNLNVGEKYWFKIELLNPQAGSYYLLKGVNKTKSEFKLLSKENNNYINTFSNLKFNIYSKNISQSFNKIPVLQEYFDNPYTLIGLHKGEGFIKRLQVNKYNKSLSGNDYMGELFEEEPTVAVFKIIKKVNGRETELPTEEIGE